MLNFDKETFLKLYVLARAIKGESADYAMHEAIKVWKNIQMEMNPQPPTDAYI